MYVHGGAWSTLDKAVVMVPMLRALADSDRVVVVSVNYRLAPETIWPGALAHTQMHTYTHTRTRVDAHINVDAHIHVDAHVRIHVPTPLRITTGQLIDAKRALVWVRKNIHTWVQIHSKQHIPLRTLANTSTAPPCILTYTRHALRVCQHIPNSRAYTQHAILHPDTPIHAHTNQHTHTHTHTHHQVRWGPTTYRGGWRERWRTNRGDDHSHAGQCACGQCRAERVLQMHMYV